MKKRFVLWLGFFCLCFSLLFPKTACGEWEETPTVEPVPFEYQMDRMAAGNWKDQSEQSDYFTSEEVLSKELNQAVLVSDVDDAIRLYALDEDYAAHLSIPANKAQSYQISISTSQTVTYRAYGDITVSTKGLVKPKATIWYRTSYGWTTEYIEGAETRTEYSYDEDSYVIASYGGSTRRYNFKVVNYAREYAESVMDTYLSNCRSQGLSDYELLVKITAFPASYDYDGNYSGYVGLIVAGGGDCWASTSAILYLCEHAGIKAHLRYGVNEPGAGSGHRNVAALIGNTVYVCEAGYSGSAPRYYSVSDEGQGYYCHYTDGGYEIVQYDGFSSDLVIPSEYNGRPITGIAKRAFYYGEYYSDNPIKSVILPDTIQYIAAYAFSQTSVESIKISSSVTDITEMAFVDADKLTELIIDEKNSSYKVERGVLYTYDKKMLVEVLGYCNQQTLRVPKGVEIIGQYALVNANQVESIVFPSTVTSLEEGSVYHCNVQNVYFTGDPPSFDEWTFAMMTLKAYYPQNNAKWTKEVLSDYSAQSITWVAYDASVYSDVAVVDSGVCGSSLTWSYDEEGVLSIKGNGTMRYYDYIKEVPWYSYAEEIKEVRIANTVTSIGDFAFYGLKSLKEITIPDSVTVMGDYAFKNCTGLERVTMPKRMTKLGESAFFGCSSLKEITIPEGIYTVWEYSFKNCTSLASVSLPQSLIKLDEAAFYGCSSLEEITIPDGCSIVGAYCFKNCTKLKDVTLPASLGQLREAVLYGTAIEILNVPSKVTSVGPYAFKKCVNLSSISLPANLTLIDEAAFYECDKLAEIEIPDAVTRIGNYAFRRCTGLTEVAFPASLQTVGECSFYGTGLVEVDLPEGMTEIKDYAFKACDKLTSVTLPSSVTSLGESAFNSCPLLASITIPENVTTVKDYCFSGDVKLKEIRFLGDAPTIGTGAFKNVNAKVYYPAGKSGWTSSVRVNYGGTLNWISF